MKKSDTSHQMPMLSVIPTQIILLWIAFLIMIILPTPIQADMGRVVATEAQVSEDSQKAIILHNREEEVLILGTDLKADKSARIIRFIPFPEEPKVQLASPASFESAMDLIKKHGLKFIEQTKGGRAAARAVEMRFNQRLGSHDVTVIRINDAAEFNGWVREFLRQKGLQLKREDPKIEAVVRDYTRRGFVWFVFDFVTVNEQIRFVEPIQYRFKTKELYYPLKTSNTFGGSGMIDLILITPGTFCEPLQSYYGGCFGFQEMRATTSSQLENDEMKGIFPGIGQFSKNQNMFIQLMRYQGDYEFDQDLLGDFGQAVPYAIGHVEEAWGSPWLFPMEENVKDLKERCRLKPDSGPCKAIFWRYFFNPETQKCEKFVYGGCEGTVPFETKEECVALCEKDGGASSTLKNINFEEFTPSSKHFTLQIPAGWPREEYDIQRSSLLSGNNKYELTVRAPGQEGLEYLSVRVAWHRDACGTPERFIYDLLNPRFSSRRADAKVLPLTGPEAKTLEIKKVRQPFQGMNAKPVKAIERYVVIPAHTGFYVLVYDAPEALFKENKWVFDKILSSFQPMVSLNSKPEPVAEVSDDEYEVYADFFSAEEVRGFEIPPYFSNTYRARHVYHETSAGKNSDKQTLTHLMESFGALDKSIMEDYREKNKRVRILRDRMVVPWLEILQTNEPNREGGRGMEQPLTVFPDEVFLSRIGFNEQKDTALFYVSQNGAPMTGYFVLMVKKKNRWVIKNAVLEDFKIPYSEISPSFQYTQHDISDGKGGR